MLIEEKILTGLKKEKTATKNARPPNRVEVFAARRPREPPTLNRADRLHPSAPSLRIKLP
jgi:hypothetical protein